MKSLNFKNCLEFLWIFFDDLEIKSKSLYILENLILASRIGKKVFFFYPSWAKRNLYGILRRTLSLGKSMDRKKYYQNSSYLFICVDIVFFSAHTYEYWNHECHQMRSKCTIRYFALKQKIAILNSICKFNIFLSTWSINSCHFKFRAKIDSSYLKSKERKA